MSLATLVCKSVFLCSSNEHLETEILKLAFIVAPQNMKCTKICIRSVCEM